MYFFGLDQPELGQRIDKARKTIGLTFDEVAQKTGYDERTIRNIVGRKRARARTIRDICECVNLGEIVERKEIQAASDEFGGYTFETVKCLEGDYLCVRPVFKNPTTLNAYLIQMRWDKSGSHLVFEERERPDPRYAQSGIFYHQSGRPFFHLVSGNRGDLRMYTLAWPEGDGIARGVISTLSNPRGAVYIPVAAPIFLRSLGTTDPAKYPPTGYITADHPSYLEYQETLQSVTDDEYCVFVMNTNPSDRRGRISVVGS
jgi:hypothetical protein